MTIAVDQVASSTLSTDPSNFDFNSGTSPEGLIVLIAHGSVSTDIVVGVTYGGIAMTRRQSNVDTTTEAGRTYIYTLESGVPSGTNTVSVDRTEGTTTMQVCAISVNAAGPLSFVDSDGINENIANPTVTLQYGGQECMSFGILYTGGAAPPGATGIASGCTNITGVDLTAFATNPLRQTTAGVSDFTIGWTTLTSDDVAFSAVALTDAAAAPFPIFHMPDRSIYPGPTNA